jgi:hypothetical protein
MTEATYKRAKRVVEAAEDETAKVSHHVEPDHRSKLGDYRLATVVIMPLESSQPPDSAK